MDASSHLHETLTELLSRGLCSFRWTAGISCMNLDARRENNGSFEELFLQLDHHSLPMFKGDFFGRALKRLLTCGKRTRSVFTTLCKNVS